MFLEQMFTAELYLWHLLLEKDCTVAQNKGVEMPKLEDLKRNPGTQYLINRNMQK